MPAPSSPAAPRDDRHRCDNCGGPKAIFIDGDRNLCRHCIDIPQQHRPALNALMRHGLIYPKGTT
jgi:hypothetical protein